MRRFLICVIFALKTISTFGKISFHHNILKAIRNTAAVSLLINTNTLPSFADDIKASQYVYQGMSAFRNNQVEESIQLFNQAEKESQFVSNRLWQLGISEYYQNQYNACFDQFTKDIPDNPNDTEEVIWSILCATGKQPPSRTSTSSNSGSIKEVKGIQKLNDLIFKYTRIEDDPRPIMRTIQALFVNNLNKQSINDVYAQKELMALHTLQDIASQEKNFGNNADYFYSNLYLSLYESMIGDISAAVTYGDKAVTSTYSQKSRDYMIAVAKVNQLKLLSLQQL